MSHGLDLRAGAYFDGGAAVDGTIRTTATETHVRWDDLRGSSGVAIAAHGATAIANGDRADSVAWDVDALRGARAVQATTDLDAAAKPFDSSDGPGGVALGRAGCWARSSAPWPCAGAPCSTTACWRPSSRFVAPARSGTRGRTTRPSRADRWPAEASGRPASRAPREGRSLASRLGGVGTTLALRGLGDVADDGEREGVDGVAQVRATVDLPMAREYASADATDPWVHRTEPRLEAAVLAAHTDGVLVVPAGRGAPDAIGEEAAWIGAAGWSNTVGRIGSRAAMDVDVAGGAIGDSSGARPLLRARAAMGGPWLGIRADFARVLQVRSLDATAQSGGAFIGSARIGPASGLHLAAHVAERDGVDPYVAAPWWTCRFERGERLSVDPGLDGRRRPRRALRARASRRAAARTSISAPASWWRRSGLWSSTTPATASSCERRRRTESGATASTCGSPWTCPRRQIDVTHRLRVGPGRCSGGRMKGDPRIIDLLNEVLTGELTAISQYFLHAKMCLNWGYEHLGKKIYEESIDEMKHADKLIERVLFLDGLPNLQKLSKLAIGQTVIEILEERSGARVGHGARLNKGIQLCRDVGDNGSEDLLTHILVESEKHVDWLESQLELAQQVGDAQYLSQQIR